MNKTIIIIITIFVLLMLAQTGIADSIVLNDGINITNQSNIWVNVSNSTTYTYSYTDGTTTHNISNTSSNSTWQNITLMKNGTITFILLNDTGIIVANSSITLDRTAPTLTSSYPSNNTRYLYTEIGDKDYSIVIDEIIDDNRLNTSSITPTINPTILDKSFGDHTYTITATDLAGNTMVETINYRVITPQELNSAIQRTLDTNYIMPTQSINVTLTPLFGDFSFYTINETLNSSINVTFDNTTYNNINVSYSNTTNGDTTIHTFTGVKPLQSLVYHINTSIQDAKHYNITGTFKDADNNPGIIPLTDFWYATDNSQLFHPYDTNDDYRFQKSEVINAVVSYFRGNITFIDIIKIVTQYFLDSVF